MAAPPLGSQGALFLKKESSYGADPTLAATNAMRFIELDQNQWNPFNRVSSPEHKSGAGVFDRMNRKSSGVFGIAKSWVRPSQTLNTLPEADPVFEAGFGAVTNRTNSSTVQASPTPTASVFTIGAGAVAAAGYVVGDAVLVAVTGETKSPFVRWISAISTDQLTVEPDLPAAPASGDAVKGCITCKLTDLNAISLYGAHNQVGGDDRVWEGINVDRLRFIFDQNEEPAFNCSGMVKRQITTGHADFPSIPASSTFVGTAQPPSGTVGEMWIDNTVYKFMHAEAELTNKLKVRNMEYGEGVPTESYRAGKRAISVSVNSFTDVPATLYDKSEAGSYVQMLIQTGITEGNIVALYTPRVDFNVPGQTDPENEAEWGFNGVGLESVFDQGDEISLALA